MTLQRETLTASDAVAYGFLVEEDESTGALCNSFVQLFFTALDARRALACSSPDIQVVICEEARDVSPLNLAAALHKDNPLRDIYLQKTEPSGLFISRLEAAGARGSVDRSETERLLGLPATQRDTKETTDNAGTAAEECASSIMCEAKPADDIDACDEEAPGLLDGHEKALPVFLNAYFVEGEGAPLELYDDAFYEEHGKGEEAAGLHEEGPGRMAAEAALSDEGRERISLPEVKGALSAPLDIAWLEEVIDLDDLDDTPLGTGQAVVEKPPVSQQADVGAQQMNPQPVMVAETEQDKGASVVAFVSGRGGVGKSSLTILTAMELWQSGLKVAVLDMDLQFGDLSILAGHEPKSNIKRINIELLCTNQMRIPQPEQSLLLIEPPQTPELAEELVNQVPQVLAALRSVVDVVLINTSCLWNEAAAVLARSVDRLVICMDQRATSVSAARQIIELCVRLQIPSTRLLFLLNRCSRNAPITDIDASLAMGGVDVISIAEGGTDVDELLSLGCPLEVLTAQAALRQSIQGLGRALLAEVGHSDKSAGW